MIRLSVVMIVKNESACIENCLKSIKDADEIIVLDTGSTDTTGDIVRKYTNKYFPDEYRWNDDFAEARNLALSKATGDWILTIDADERLEGGGIEKCKKGIEIAEKNNHRAVNCHCIAMGGKGEHYQPRLYKRSPDIFWKGKIHNYLNVVENNKSNIVVYYGYSPAHNNDPNRAMRILLKEVKSHPDCIREKFYLAREYGYRNNFVESINWYMEYLKLANWPPEMAEAWFKLAECYFHLGDLENAKFSCIKAISINANFREPILFLANMCGPKNSKRWLEFAKTASNEDVLFLRNQ